MLGSKEQKISQHSITEMTMLRWFMVKKDLTGVSTIIKEKIGVGSTRKHLRISPKVILRCVEKIYISTRKERGPDGGLL